MKSSRRLEFAPEAENDFEIILAYFLATWSPEQRDATAERLLAGMQDLRFHPYLGRVRNDLLPGLRGRPIWPHVVLYIQD